MPLPRTTVTDEDSKRLDRKAAQRKSERDLDRLDEETSEEDPMDKP